MTMGKNCGARCPEEPAWVCQREIDHDGRHESPAGGDWHDNVPIPDWHDDEPAPAPTVPSPNDITAQRERALSGPNGSRVPYPGIPAHWTCPECGPHVAADEDGCCVQCGSNCGRGPCLCPPSPSGDDAAEVARKHVHTKRQSCPHEGCVGCLGDVTALADVIRAYAASQTTALVAALNGWRDKYEIEHIVCAEAVRANQQLQAEVERLRAAPTEGEIAFAVLEAKWAYERRQFWTDAVRAALAALRGPR